MKKYLLGVLVLSILVFSTPSSAQLSISQANFSNNLTVGNKYSWTIENYQLGDRRIENRQPAGSFQFIHRSRVDLTILEDPNQINLANADSLQNEVNLTSYFKLSYDDIVWDSQSIAQLYIWIFPVTGTTTEGKAIDLLDNFWIYNLANILVNGTTYSFHSSLPTPDKFTSSTKDGERSINLVVGDTDLLARVDEGTGVLNSISLVGKLSGNDFRLEINRRGGGSGALPLPAFWIVLPLVAIPVFIRYYRRRQ